MLFTHHQHAREHLTVEMALYLHQRADHEVRHRLRGSRDLVNSREIWIVAGPQPGRRRVRHRHRLLPLLAQEPAAQLRLLGRRHRPQPQLGLPAGAAAAARPAARRQRDLPRPVRRAPRPRSSAVVDFVHSRVVGGVQQIKTNIDFHTVQRAGALAVRLHVQRHRARADRGRRTPRSARSASSMAATNGYTPRAGQRPLHHRRRRSTTGCGARTRSSATPSRCTRPAPAAAASTRRTR